ncbi:uncharacterized protein LOC135465385 [Liolophura sinensis]|uniref:uncharacterized protein LOC135465385 n=1 Tax=Liolophura sinensis TaxID=3198878 RepID=UPI00315989D9
MLKLFVALLAFVCAVVGDQCTTYHHPKYGSVGKCMQKSCCAYGTYISNLCPGDSNVKCCFSHSTCGEGSVGTGGSGCSGSRHYSARGTAYYPDPSPLEGGYNDRHGVKLRTLQDFLEGSASYVSVAMDQYLNLPYGTILCIPELDRKYGKHIIFKVVDTGSAFNHKGYSRIDICVRDQQHSYDAAINNHITLVFK